MTYHNITISKIKDNIQSHIMTSIQYGYIAQPYLYTLTVYCSVCVSACACPLMFTATRST